MYYITFLNNPNSHIAQRIDKQDAIDLANISGAIVFQIIGDENIIIHNPRD